MNKSKTKNMNDKQAEKIIELLEKMNSKLEDIEYNTSQLTNLTSDIFVLDEIHKLIKYKS